MKFDELLADYFLGNRSTSQLPSIALEGMKEGIETESLIILAGMNDSDNPHSINSYFEQTLNELEIVKYQPRKCANILLTYYLKKIVNKSENAFGLMIQINNDIYNQINFDKEEHQNCKFLGSELGLEKMYTWYRELQDWEDGSALLYYNELGKEQQREKFIEELIKEAEILLNILEGKSKTNNMR